MVLNVTAISTCSILAESDTSYTNQIPSNVHSDKFLIIMNKELDISEIKPDEDTEQMAIFH